jgi:hypothetical protein
VGDTWRMGMILPGSFTYLLSKVIVTGFYGSIEKPKTLSPFLFFLTKSNPDSTLRLLSN